MVATLCEWFITPKRSYLQFFVMCFSNFIPHQSFTPNSSTDQDSLKSAMELSENDWEQFLLHRSEELVKGKFEHC